MSRATPNENVQPEAQQEPVRASTNVAPAVVSPTPPVPNNVVELPHAEAPTVEGHAKKRVYRRRDEKALRDLLEMLSTCRPCDTLATADFAQKWLKPLGAKPDKRGNWHLKVLKADKTESEVLWSSHIDTVHWKEGEQKLTFNATTGMLRIKDGETASCLGADCTTGVWLMREMVLARVPGYYIWHEAEESGGRGSSHVAKNFPKRLANYKAAIAFDRKGYASIITHQAGGKCCSEKFSESLATMLPGNYKSDSGGTFTDTANYTKIIPECTNISVGYFSQHTKSEEQDIPFALKLRAALLVFDESKLVIDRKPGDSGPAHYGRYSSSYGGLYGHGGGSYRGADYDRYFDDGYAGGYSPPEQRETHRSIVYDIKSSGMETAKCGGFCDNNCVGICKDKDRVASFKALRRIALARDPDAKISVRVEWAKNLKTSVMERTYTLQANGKEITVGDNSPAQDGEIERSCRTMKEFIMVYPDAVLDWMEQWGIGLKDLYDYYKDLP